MLYYAGHGLQLDWRNYMVPVDANLQNSADVLKQTIDIEDVIKTFKASGTRMNILVLDACRDNPFSDKGSGKGLAQLDAPPGTYLAFATAPGNVAEDGDETSGNGLFTQYLIKELQRPGSIESVFKRVRLQVRQSSQGRQIPWDSSSLEDEFAFNDGKKFALTPEDYQREIRLAKEREERLKREVEAAAAREKQLALMREQEKQRLAQAQRIQEEQARLKAEAQARERERQLALAAEQERQKSIAAAAALERARAEEAQRLKDLELAKAQRAEEEQRRQMSIEAARDRQFAQEKTEWDLIKDSTKADDFYAFLLKYPTGVITQQAHFKLEQLAKAKITAQADKNGQVQVLGEPRFRMGDQWTVVTRSDYTGQVMDRATYKIDKIENGLVYYSSEKTQNIRTIDGGAIRVVTPVSTNIYDPPRMDMPGDDLAVGKRWTGATRETIVRLGTFQRSDSFRIVAYEKIKVPAGEFWAYRIELETKSGPYEGSSVYWVQPDWGAFIKYIRRTYGPTGTIKTTSELESIVRGPKHATVRVSAAVP